MLSCPRCGARAAPAVLAKSAELRPAIVRLIAQANPGWLPEQGICPPCALVYAQQFAQQRSLQSLHTATDPHTTFPYYHLAEEMVFSQTERLPDYPAFTGSGVTIAFLDSGYYPHPDLAEPTSLPTPSMPWQRLTPSQWRTLLEAAQLRLVDYVDLTDDGERVGLDQPSLWTGSGDSWHGQMTTTMAAGNGFLSGGLYRGYAPEARLLPIKIGRGGGRIPEEDILRGLQWLLRDDNWQRYNVSVLNVSVGGDFPEAWNKNAVCLAAEELAAKGVFIAAAAGNSNRAQLLAPAQAPAVLTVGGVEDQNLLWESQSATDYADLALYPHNYGTTLVQRRRLHKPELLALARWLPAPILPVSPIFKEMAALGALRRILLDEDENRFIDTQGSTLDGQLGADRPPTWMPEVWQAVRRRMNAHKWIHPFYQHVDGTSVAVAQVSAVAAQMLEANPDLTATEVKAILLKSARPLPGKSAERVGAGLLQPAAAVAAALRARQGDLGDYPKSGTLFNDSELQKWTDRGKVTVREAAEPQTSAATAPVYLGIYAPQARAVSLVGAFNQWQPGVLPLQPAAKGWWHLIILLPPGAHCYRFWIEPPHDLLGSWQPDPENPIRCESGYTQGHSVITIVDPKNVV